ncbi:hypothetical protein BDN72DRAFT_751180, partial [Pluteus cervinus]
LFVLVSGRPVYSAALSISTTDLICSDFVHGIGQKTHPLRKPVRLQMATKGAHSTINHGVRAEVQLGMFSCNRYFDVSNVEGYDAILGAGFLRDYGVSLSFGEKAGVWGSPGIQESQGETCTPVKVGAKDRPSISDEVRRGLREKWVSKIKDLWWPEELTLPPWREVNHEIRLLDPLKRIAHPKARCAEDLRPQFMAKMNRYETAGLWISTTSPSSAPMLCLRK